MILENLDWVQTVDDADARAKAGVALSKVYSRKELFNPMQNASNNQDDCGLDRTAAEASWLIIKDTISCQPDHDDYRRGWSKFSTPLGGCPKLAFNWPGIRASIHQFKLK